MTGACPTAFVTGACYIQLLLQEFVIKLLTQVLSYSYCERCYVLQIMQQKQLLWQVVIITDACSKIIIICVYTKFLMADACPTVIMAGTCFKVIVIGTSYNNWRTNGVKHKTNKLSYRLIKYGCWGYSCMHLF